MPQPLPRPQRIASQARRHQRQCVVCRQYLPKTSLFRFVAAWDSLPLPLLSQGVQLPLNATASKDLRLTLPQGRSAYLCRSPHCWQRLERQRFTPLHRALKANFSPSFYQRLQPTLAFSEATEVPE